MVAPNEETVEYNILLNAKEALASLREFNTAAENTGDTLEGLQVRMNNLSMVIQRAAEKAGISFEQMEAELEKLNTSLGGGSLLGRNIAQIQTQLTESMKNNAGVSEKKFNPFQDFVSTEAQPVMENLNKIGAEWKVVGDKSEEAGKKAESGAKKAEFATRAWNIAVGMLIHQGINLLINAFQSMFTMAIKGLRELETATYNLVQAERTLSEQGINITPQGLDESIKKLQKLDPLLSKIQATEAVSRVSSLVAPAVGLNAKEIDQLTQAIAVLAVKNKGLGKSFEEVESQVSNAFLSGKVSVGINQLGVKITDQIVKDEALRLGLVKTAEEYDKLTGKMQANVKARAMLSVLTQSTSKDIAHLPEFFKTADAQFTIFQARMQDFFTQIGVMAAPVLIKLFSSLAEGFQKATEWLDQNKEAISAFAGVVAEAIPIVVKLATIAIKFAIDFTTGIFRVVKAIQSLIDRFPALKKAIDLVSGKTTPDIGLAADTPTSTGLSEIDKERQQAARDNLIKAEQETEKKLTEIFKDARDKRADIDRDYQNKLQDIARDYARKLEDIGRNTAQKNADAQTDYAKKVADINADTEKKKIDAQTEAHKKAVDAEKQYQDELKKLREKYLMDLEEALHERDARQILRLMRQYQIDKDNAKKQKADQAQQTKDELAQKMKDIEQERKDKLAQAKKDLADKLKDIKLAASRERQEANIAHQRALSDARTAHQRQLEEQRIFLQRKLRDLAESIAQEYKLTAAGQAAINQLIANAMGAVPPSSINNPLTSAQTMYTGGTPTVSSTWAQAGLFGTGGMAEGGTFLATRPQTINVGEKRPEVITATPLGKPGRDISKVFANGNIGGNGSGKMEIALTLSPDLEARIISNTLDETANVVARINRIKS